MDVNVLGQTYFLILQRGAYLFYSKKDHYFDIAN